MKKSIISFMLLAPFFSYAGPNVIDMYINTINFPEQSKAADGTPLYSYMYGSGQTTNPICGSPDANYVLGKVELLNTAQYFGQMASHSLTYNLFNSNWESYKFTYLYLNNWFNGDIKNTSLLGATIPAPGRYVAFSGTRINSARIDPNASKHILFVYKGPGREPDGVGVIRAANGNPIFQYFCYDTDGTLREIDNINVNDIIFNNKIRACVPTEGTATVTLKPVSIEALKNANELDLVSPVQRNFSLKCDENVSVWVSLVDLSTSGNITQTAGLASGSTATGIGFGVKFAKDGALMYFGDDTSSKFETNNPGANWSDRVKRKFIVDSGPIKGVSFSYGLIFGYMRTTANPTSGTANGLIGLTYSYQ